MFSLQTNWRPLVKYGMCTNNSLKELTNIKLYRIFTVSNDILREYLDKIEYIDLSGPQNPK
jgi:hypothetical protein